MRILLTTLSLILSLSVNADISPSKIAEVETAACYHLEDMAQFKRTRIISRSCSIYEWKDNSFVIVYDYTYQHPTSKTEHAN